MRDMRSFRTSFEDAFKKKKKIDLDKDDGTCLECTKLLADICGICHRTLIEEAKKEMLRQEIKFLESIDMTRTIQGRLNFLVGELAKLKSLEEKE
jgi:CBS-domain-containing membrane protein